MASRFLLTLPMLRERIDLASQSYQIFIKFNYLSYLLVLTLCRISMSCDKKTILSLPILDQLFKLFVKIIPSASDTSERLQNRPNVGPHTVKPIVVPLYLSYLLEQC